MLEELVTRFGYPALFIGMVLEGETVLVLAGFMAHRDYLSLPWVMVVAFLGSVAGDQTFYFIGRWKGPAAIERKPEWRDRAQRLGGLLQKHQTLVALGFRFVYGARAATPVLLGATGFPVWRFVLLNMLGAAIWSVAFALIGYFFGEAAEAALGKLQHYEGRLAIALIACGIVAWAVHQLIRWRRRRKAVEAG